MQTTDIVNNLDLRSYVDGQLDDWQCARVEAWLADHPDHAAAVMQDLRLQRELRIAMTSAPSAEVLQARDRLARGLHRDASLRGAMRFAPVAAVAGFCWLVWSGLVPLGVKTVNASVVPPDFVTAAVAAREAIAVRLPMHSMSEDPTFDAEELRSVTGIRLPDFDPDWKVVDAQIFPSPQGPGIEIVFETEELGRVNYFAVRPSAFSVSLPETMLLDQDPLSWFQIGETAHVLIAERGDEDRLETAATTLTHSLY